MSKASFSDEQTLCCINIFQDVLCHCAVSNVSDSHNALQHISEKTLPKVCDPTECCRQLLLGCSTTKHIDLAGVEFAAGSRIVRHVMESQSRPGIVDYPKVQLRSQIGTHTNSTRTQSELLVFAVAVPDSHALRSCHGAERLWRKCCSAECWHWSSFFGFQDPEV